MKPIRQQPGKHVRAVMGDRRWILLPLAARAVWLQLTDLADVMPELRHPVSGAAVDESELCRLLAASADEFHNALTSLVERQIVEPVPGGYRLRVY